MTFKETDFPDVLDQIESICRNEKNPAAAVEIIRQIIRIYRQIPIYPGLVELVSNAVEEEVQTEELEPGDLVTLKDGGEFYLGEIKEINNNQVHLEKTIHSESKGEMEIELNRFSDCKKINKDALKQEWPELHYEDDN